MNREFKFRFWDIKEKEMFYPDFADLLSGCHYIEREAYIMQYSGVHDRTDEETEVFEGDMIEFDYKGTKYIGEV